jgi:hypothetical protein
MLKFEDKGCKTPKKKLNIFDKSMTKTDNTQGGENFNLDFEMAGNVSVNPMKISVEMKKCEEVFPSSDNQAVKMKANGKGRIFSPVIAAANRNATLPSGKSTVKSKKFKTSLKSTKLSMKLQNNSPGFKAKKIFFEKGGYTDTYYGAISNCDIIN